MCIRDRLMPCLPWKSRDDDAAGDAEDARAREDDDDDDDGAVAALDALARREARRTRARDEMRRGVGTRAKGAGAARGRIEGATTRVVDASDSGPVEIALRALRSEQYEREIEREARERHERDGEPRLRDKVDGLGNANARGKRKMTRERFACSLYAKRGGDDGKWANLGRRACEPSVAHEGAMCPLFRDDATRRVRVQRSLLCSPTWRAPAWCDVKETPFHLVLERLKPALEYHRDDAKKVMIDKDALCAEKGKPFADVRFVLMDLCSNDERRLELDALAKARGGAPGNKLADVVLQLTPVEFSRAWRSTRARIGTKRDVTPAHEMPFEALADQYDDALVQANAVVGVEHYRQRKERLKAARQSKPFVKDDHTSPSHRLISVDDAVALGDFTAVASVKTNRAVGARSRRHQPPLTAAR